MTYYDVFSVISYFNVFDFFFLVKLEVLKFAYRKDDIRLESVKALRSVSTVGEEAGEKLSNKLPDFVSMINFIKEKASLRQQSQHKYTMGSVAMPFNPLAYTEVRRLNVSQNSLDNLKGGSLRSYRTKFKDAHNLCL